MLSNVEEADSFDQVPPPLLPKRDVVFVQQPGKSEVNVLEVEVPLIDEEGIANFPPSLHAAGSGQVHEETMVFKTESQNMLSDAWSNLSAGMYVDVRQVVAWRKKGIVAEQTPN